MRRYFVQSLLALAAALTGLAWGVEGLPWAIGLSVFLPFLWHKAGNRWAGGAIALAYYLAASRAMPLSTGIFFEASAPAAFGWALWLAVGLANAALWAALWSADSKKRIWRLPAVLLLTAIPPIGLVGWANPLTAAGVFFPEAGWVGLLLLVGFMASCMTGRLPAIAVFAVAAIGANVSAALWPQTPPASGWAGVDTSYGKLATGSDDYMAAYGRLQAVKGLAETTPAGSVLVLPETVLGRFGEAAEAELTETSRRLDSRGATVLVGAEVASADGRGLQNVLVALGAGHGQQLVQRVPIPIGMWKPWASESVVADPLGHGVAQVAGRQVGYLICYEQILVFPVLRSMLDRPDVLVAVANSWWARGTSAPVIQRQVTALWGRLFARPVIQAFNA